MEGVVDLRVGGLESLLCVGPVSHLLESLPFLLGQVVPPNRTLLVELLDLLVNQLVRILALMLRPTGLHEHAIGGVLLFSLLRHGLVLVSSVQFDSGSRNQLSVERGCVISKHIPTAFSLKS